MLQAKYSWAYQILASKTADNRDPTVSAYDILNAISYLDTISGLKFYFNYNVYIVI